MPGINGLYVIPAPNSVDYLNKADEISNVCKSLANDFDYIIIDCPAGVDKGFRAAVAPANLALVVVTPDAVSVRDAEKVGEMCIRDSRTAANFNKSSLLEAVKYCHERDVKVHLALNTLITDNEINTALNEAQYACEIGIDAIIIQDIGLASLISRAAPDMPLHASTQMSVHRCV